MLVELSVTEHRCHAFIEVISGVREAVLSTWIHAVDAVLIQQLNAQLPGLFRKQGAQPPTGSGLNRLPRQPKSSCRRRSTYRLRYGGNTKGELH